MFFEAYEQKLVQHDSTMQEQARRGLIESQIKEKGS